MKKLILTGLIFSLILPCIFTQSKEIGRLSPYFFVPGGDPNLDTFPLLETKTKVNIAGIIAEVELTQVYKNEGKRTIEAIYVFPLGVKSAIHKMQIRIGERIIEAKIEERERAKAIYETAKQEGKITSLLEQERPNVFQMRVANIMPNDKVEVVVHYTELLVPENGVYEFVYPTVVGPRYGGNIIELKDTDYWIENPYLHEGKDPTYNFDIQINLATPIPISKIFVPSHKVDINYTGKDKAEIKLSKEEIKGGNRDFILRYSLEGDVIQSGLLLYPDKEENFFLFLAQPPKRVNLEDIPGREYIFVVDVSGSMHGFPLEISKVLITRLINGLREKDYFNILFFSGGSSVLSEHPLPATNENKKRAVAMLNSQVGGGGTEILSALQKILSLEKKEGFSRIVVIATDGYVAVEKETFDLIRKNLSEANVFAFGIGTAVNRYLIEGIAKAGRGEPFIATNQGEARKIADKFLKYVSSPLLTDIRVDCTGIDAYDIEPVSIPDLFADRPIIIYGKYKNPKGKIKIIGKTVHGEYVKEFEVNPSLEDKANIALKYLWAREKIASLADYAGVGEDVRKQVTEIGLKYSLMTEYTSFVAVDTVKRDTGEVVTVKQPLPLPQGVSDYAVGMQKEFSSVGNIFYCTENLSLYSYGSGSSGYHSMDINEKFGAGSKARELAQVYLEGGSFPIGTSMQEIENLLDPFKEELGKLFREWALKRVEVILQVKNGKIEGIQIKKYEGKECKKEVLENILKKITFSSSFTGKIELQLSYI